MDTNKLQELIEGSETELREFASNADIVFWVCEPDVSKFHYISPGYEKIWGKPCSEIYDNPLSFLDTVHEDDVAGKLKAVQTNPTSMDEEYRIIRSDGEVRWIHDCTFPVYNSDGQLYRITGFAEDITERKLAEIALFESEHKFRQLVDNLDAVFWVFDPNFTKCDYISPGYDKVWGRSCKEVYNHPRSFVDAVHANDRERVIAATFNQGNHHTPQEYRIIRPNDEIRWIYQRTFPVNDESGKLYRQVGIAEDITYRKQAEEEIFKALQLERELSEAKSKFIANISHEIRTPLATIQSSLDMLQHYESKLTGDKKQGHFQKIETAVGQITQIAQDTLFLSEVSVNALKVQCSDVDVVELCKKLVDSILNDTDSKARIDFTSPEENIRVFIDPKLTQHILTNLLQNALKFSNINTKVKFNLNFSSLAVIFTITDEGIGIPASDILQLFSSFYRGSNVGNIGGTGLGLAIVKQCVDLHSGEITVNSSVGKGTTFVVTLPRDSAV